VAKYLGINRVSGNSAKSQKPGFSDFLGWVAQYLGINRVSGNSAKSQKPGFSDFLGWVAQYLGINRVSGNSAKSKKPGFSDFLGGEIFRNKPGFWQFCNKFNLQFTQTNKDTALPCPYRN